MTFIQPSKNTNLWNAAFFALGACVVLCVILMVALYNATVNMNHNIATAKADLDAVGAKSVEMNNHIVAIMSRGNLGEIAARDGLVAESRPQYVTLGTP